MATVGGVPKMNAATNRRRGLSRRLAVLVMFTASLVHFAARAQGLGGAFDPEPNGFVQPIAIQPDGKILVGGGFTQIDGGAPRVYLARVNIDGSLDATFSNPAASNYVEALAVQAD